MSLPCQSMSVFSANAHEAIKTKIKTVQIFFIDTYQMRHLTYKNLVRRNRREELVEARHELFFDLPLQCFYGTVLRVCKVI